MAGLCRFFSNEIHHVTIVSPSIKGVNVTLRASALSTLAWGRGYNVLGDHSRTRPKLARNFSLCYLTYDKDLSFTDIVIIIEAEDPLHRPSRSSDGV